ncbi:MAG: 30S ribosomal protein S7 [bacterium]|nr:30S ribosomal protein S7 [bacterium]
MRRARKHKKIDAKPDYKHKRVDLGRFLNYLMKAGGKSTAEKMLYKALDVIEEKTKSDPIKTFETAIANASPLVEVASRRVGGANYQIPIEVRPERKFFLAAHWIIKAARTKKGTPMHIRLAEQIMQAAKNEGEAIKKKQDTHRIAEANRAFASFLRR